MIEPVSATVTPQQAVPSIQMLKYGCWVLELTLLGLALAGNETLSPSTSPYYQI